MQHPLIIGLSGTFASGKDTLAQHLVNNFGFMHLSTGDILRQEALRLRGSIERPVLFEVGNKLRTEQGADVFVAIALNMFKAHAEKYKGAIISGVRSIGEAEAIKAQGKLVFVDAPLKVRYQRIMSRQRDGEAGLTLEEFAASEAQESDVDPSNKAIQNLTALRQMADIELTNAADPDSFLATGVKALGLS